jgi:type IV pilus assembly protein PilM
LRVDAYGSAALEDGMLRGPQIVKPEAVARRLVEMLERSAMRIEDLQDDIVVLALPSHGLKTRVVDCPSGLPPRALRAWCERRAALLLPGDGEPDLRSRVGVTWADPGSHRLRLYACEATLVDDRIAVMEMSGLRPHAIDAAHKAGRRAFLSARSEARERTPNAPTTDAPRTVTPAALLQIDAREIELAVFDGQRCVADVSERFDGVDGHPEALASVIRELSTKLPVVPQAIHLVVQEATPGELAAICEAVASACGIAVYPFAPLDALDAFDASDATEATDAAEAFDNVDLFDVAARGRTAAPAGSRYQPAAQGTTLAVPYGLALRAMSMQGVSCE